MKTIIRAFALSAVALATSAHAEGFKGAYAGPLLAYDMAELSATAAGVTASISEGGVSAGGVIGYNAEVSKNVIIGAEVTGLFGGPKIDDAGTTVKSDYSISVGARVGYVAGPALLFGKVAYARSRFTADDGFTKESDDGDGFQFGGGVEVPFTDRFVGRVEYAHIDYNVDQTLLGAGVTTKFKRDQIIAGVTYRF